MTRSGRDQLRAFLRSFSADGGALVGEAVGVHGVTEGLTAGVVRTPLSESAAVGVAAGMALAGRRVIVELVDPAGLTRAADVLGDLASLRARSAGTFAAPLVILAPFAADLPSIPGLRVAVAAAADDVVGLVGHALAAGDPVVVLLSAAALDDAGAGGAVPGLGVAVTRRAGSGVTVLAVGDGVAAALAAEGDAEVIDLRALSPLDTAAIGASVRRTGRAVAVGAPSALFAALDQAFLSLESPLASLPAAASPADVSAAVARALSY